MPDKFHEKNSSNTGNSNVNVFFDWICSVADATAVMVEPDGCSWRLMVPLLLLLLLSLLSWRRRISIGSFGSSGGEHSTRGTLSELETIVVAIAISLYYNCPILFRIISFSRLLSMTLSLFKRKIRRRHLVQSVKFDERKWNKNLNKFNATRISSQIKKTTTIKWEEVDNEENEMFQFN